MNKNLIFPAVMLFATSILTISCNKNNNTEPDPTPTKDSAQVTMRLTDGPSVYDNVYLDIQYVEVVMTGGASVTYNPARKGIYDIMKFRNGLDTLLLKAKVAAGTISHINLVMGSNSSVVVDGTTYALNTPTAQEGSVKLNINQAFAANGAYDVWIDFDAAMSIVYASGTYKLKPVIRAYGTTTNGVVKGNIFPLNARTTVYAINGTDTLCAIPNSTDGYFKISGMTAANYTILVNPGISGLQAYSQTNVQVNYATEVNLGSITLLP